MKKKIVIRVTGGLGNQFFVYNYYLGLKKRYPEHKIQFDKTPYFKLFSNERNDFSVKYNVNYILDFFYDLEYINKISGKIIYNIAKWNRKYLKSSILPMLALESDVNANANFFEKYDYVVLLGHFISRKYLNSNDLKYSKRIELNDRQGQALNDIRNRNSVSLHIRGGQYVNEGKIKSEYAGISKEYYEKAINYIKSKIENPLFFVFTNDPVFSKSVLSSLDSGLIFIEKNTEVVDFILMSNCKNNIIINSTFSWWAAFLNQNSDKIVVAPKVWSGEIVVNPEYNGLPMEDWIKL